jgi:hypothetical protein
MRIIDNDLVLTVAMGRLQTRGAVSGHNRCTLGSGISRTEALGAHRHTPLTVSFDPQRSFGVASGGRRFSRTIRNFRLIQLIFCHAEANQLGVSNES